MDKDMGMAAGISQITIHTNTAKDATPNAAIHTPRPETADVIQETGITAEMLILAAITDASKLEVITMAMAIQAAMAITGNTATVVMVIRMPLVTDIHIPTDATDIIAEALIIRLITPAMNMNLDIMTINIIPPTV
jgi:hypothetical protein